MRAAATAAVFICAAAGLAQTTRPATEPIRAESLAARSLAASAEALVYAPADTPARAGRLVALAEWSAELDPDHPAVHRLLAGIYESQGRLSDAADAAERALAADDAPAYALQLRWLRLAVGALDQADERLALLESVIDGEKSFASDALKAEAQCRRARILLGRGERERGRQAYAAALKLDPYNPDAINGRFALLDDPTPAETVQAFLDLLAGNPLAVRQAWNAAVQLDELGLYEQALTFFDYAREVAAAGAGGRSDLFVTHHLNALLNAGKADRALELYEDVAKQSPDSTDLQYLLIEAYRAAGRDADADAVVERLGEAYRRKRAGATVSPSFAVELAWFYLTQQDKANTALAFARQAQRSAGDDPVVRRVLGAAELASGQAENVRDGEKRLAGLIEQDIYAAVYLAEHLYEIDRPDEARKALLAGAELGRSGPAWRRLRSLAGTHTVEIPAADGAEAAAEAVDAFDSRRLEMGRAPEEFLAVTLDAPTDAVAGDALSVRATLTNTGPLDVPLGSWGLIQPSMSLQARTAGQAGRTFTNLPMAIWPAPRTLAPGESVETTVRLDVGTLGRYLTLHALDEAALTVEGVVDPVQSGEAIVSAVEALSPEPAAVSRAGLLAPAVLTRYGHAVGESPTDQYNLLLALLARKDLTGGDAATRMQASRQVAALLAMASADRRERGAPPTMDLRRGVLLSILDVALRDDSPVVRAEAVAALEVVKLDEAILTRLGRLVDDPSPLVRFRVVELIGASGTQGRQTIVDYLAGDSNPHVKRMAAAFR